MAGRAMDNTPMLRIYHAGREPLATLTIHVFSAANSQILASCEAKGNISDDLEA
jgi:hypothetical protein